MLRDLCQRYSIVSYEATNPFIECLSRVRIGPVLIMAKLFFTVISKGGGESCYNNDLSLTHPNASNGTARSR